MTPSNQRRVSTLGAHLVAIGIVAIGGPGATWCWLRLHDAGIDTFTDAIDGWSYAAFALVVVGSVVVHELLHGAGFLLFGGAPLRSIRFGCCWRFLMPYCGCTAPLRARAYMATALLPLVVLGVAPALLGFALASPTLVMYGVMMTAAAGGDVALAWALRRIPADCLVVDAPASIGFTILPSIPA